MLPFIFVLFGRPGAGKSSVAKEVIQQFDAQLITSSHQLVHIDLDDCVPQSMKDNFAKGIYPTFSERQEFAKDCCDYVLQHVRRCSLQREAPGVIQRTIILMISFSFVNTDLRERLRESFPHAHWVLIDTPQHEAELRIKQRQGHFYKSGPPRKENDAATVSANSSCSRDNSDWQFAPVTFPHIILDGTKPIKTNASIVVDWLKTEAS